MANTLDKLRECLSDSNYVESNEFELLKNISLFVNKDENADSSRELVLRALDNRESFSSCQPILDALARKVGLFPYINPESLDLRDEIAYEYHRPLNMPEDFVFHREQAEIYRRLLADENIILSAPTSFGKSKIIDALISIRKYNNLAIIVPTLALIDETRRRLAQYSDYYKIVTHLSQLPEERNVFVLTAERAIAYQDLPKIDFFAIDEFYKIGEMTTDESRTVALNQAFYRLMKMGGQFYLLGPNIQQIPPGLESQYRCYFYPTKFATVVSEQHYLKPDPTREEALIETLKHLNEPTLIFCSSPEKVNDLANALLDAGIGFNLNGVEYACDWVSETFHPDWIFTKALKKGIGIHHGRLSRALGQYIVRAFNEDKVKILICTSTLIEGVNTKAKNVIVYDHQLNRKPLSYFTFSNIKGRSGRMFHHFIGRVFSFEEPPEEQLTFVDFPMYTQDENTPPALLIQLESDDLSNTSKDRLEPFTVQKILPLNIIKQNHTISPEAQISVAKTLLENAQDFHHYLSWTAFPKYRQLGKVCELIWEYFVETSRRKGVYSHKQLTLRTWQLLRTKSLSARIMQELREGQYQAKSADEAVERVLQFERNWAGFELPRFLMAVSRIQAYIYETLGMTQGDYSVFSQQLECLFRTPVIAALDEYGIPYQTGEKIEKGLRTSDDLDTALINLKTINLDNYGLSPFEKELVQDAQIAL